MTEPSHNRLMPLQEKILQQHMTTVLDTDSGLYYFLGRMLGSDRAVKLQQSLDKVRGDTFHKILAFCYDPDYAEARDTLVTLHPHVLDLGFWNHYQRHAPQNLTPSGDDVLRGAKLAEALMTLKDVVSNGLERVKERLGTLGTFDEPQTVTDIVKYAVDNDIFALLETIVREELVAASNPQPSPPSR